jgi:hypothetical protein
MATEQQLIANRRDEQNAPRIPVQLYEMKGAADQNRFVLPNA